MAVQCYQESPQFAYCRLRRSAAQIRHTFQGFDGLKMPPTTSNVRE
jgi:hypothetical protein